MIQAIPILTRGLIPTSAGAIAGDISGVPQLTAVPSGTDKIVLELIPPADGDYLTCEIHRAAVGGQFTKLCELDTGAYEDTAVEAEQTHYYVAVALNADRKLPRLSRVAYARCLSWTAENFAFTEAAPDDIDLDSNFGRLLYRTCLVISELGTFKAVLPFLKVPPQWQSPTCVVAPGSDEESEATNVEFEVKYQFRIGFVVAGQDDGRLALQCLSLRQAIKRAFRGTRTAKMIFDDVPRHLDTNIVTSAPSPMAEIEGGALFYNAGLTIEYKVREIRGQ